MTKLVRTRMQASIAGQVTTLTPSNDSVPHPLDLNVSEIVVTLAANSAEFFKAASTGLRYTVEITVET